MSLAAVLIVTPHSSGHLPQDVMGQMLGDRRADLRARESLSRRVFLQGDPYTDVLFDVPGATTLHAWASRFVVDVNRGRGSGGPNGVVKVTDFDARPLYPPGEEPDEAEVEERLRRYWDPFRVSIERLIGERRIELLIDGHSMTGTGPKLGPDDGAARPAITLMTGGDGDGEPTGPRGPSLAPDLAREFRSLAERSLGPVLTQVAGDVPPVVALNSPWSADELSYQHGPRAGIPAFGLEVNRLLFMNEEAGEALPDRVLALRAGLHEFAAAAIAAVRQQSRRER